MQKLLVMVLVLTVSGCSSNGLSATYMNPFNWFSSKDDGHTDLTPRSGYEDTADRRPRVGHITKLSLERTSYGLIMHVSGSLPTHGYYELGLERSTEARSDQLVYEFKGWPPLNNATAGTPHQLEHSTAVFLSKQTTSGIREITVIGADNQLSRRP